MVLFPIEAILNLYAETRLSKLEQVLAGTKKHSVSWADETDIEQVNFIKSFYSVMFSKTSSQYPMSLMIMFFTRGISRNQVMGGLGA